MIGSGSRLAACIAIVLVAVMCLSMVQNVGGGDDSPPAIASTTGDPDEYVKIGWLGEVQIWNPLVPEFDEDLIVSSMIYSSLFTYDEDWNGPVYDLAVDVAQTEHVNGSIETLITISTDAYFRGRDNPNDVSNPVTALDVAATYNLIKNNSGGTYSSFLEDLSYFVPIQRSGVWDQVRFWCPFTKATILDDIAGIPILPMYEGSYWYDVRKPYDNIDPEVNVGSGMFYFEDWSQGAWYKFAKAPNYHGELDYGDSRDVDVPGVLFIVYSSIAAMCTDLNVGDTDCVDVTGSLNAFRNALGGKLAKVNVIKAATHENGITDIAINALPDCFDEGPGYLNRHPALQDPIVRKAIMMTLCKDYIVEEMLDGLAVKAASVLQPGYWQADIDEYEYDPMAAKAMLLADGWRDYDHDGWLDAGPDVLGVQMGWFEEGTELSGIRCQAIDTDENYKAIALAWPGWADDAGIELIGTYESETTMVNQAWYACDYDIWVWHWGWGPEPIGGALSTWLSSEIEKSGDNCQMPMGPWWAYKDENGIENVTTCPYISQDMIDEYDIFDQQTWDGRFSAYDQNLTDAKGVLDPAERKQILDKLQQWIYDSCCENPPYYDLGLYAYTDYNFENWGDWEAHPGLSVTSALPWIWFMLEPVENRVPILDDPPENYYTAYTTTAKRFNLTLHDVEGDEIWVNFTFGDGSPAATNHLSGDTTQPTMVEEYHQYILGGEYTLTVSICDKYYSDLQGKDVWRYIYREAAVSVAPEPNEPPDILAFSSDKSSPVNVDEYVNWSATAADPDSGLTGTDLKFTWDWDDGSYAVDVFQNVPDYTPVTSVQSHAWSSPGTYVVTLYVTDGVGGEVGGHNVSVSSMMVVIDEPLPDERSLSYRWYDMFNVSYGEWWDRRPDQVPITDSYPYIHKNYGITVPGMMLYFSNMRLDITGENLPEINMNERPLFLPFLGSTTGGTADLDWYFNYATNDELAPWPVIQVWNDGLINIFSGTTILDMTGAMSVLGMPESAWYDFDSWWAENNRTADYLDWLNYEGDERLDIYCMYECDLAPLYFWLSAERVDDTVVMEHYLISWGAECLMARWLRDAFMDNAEWFYEDFSLNAEIGSDSTDLHISAVVEDAVFAWESVYTDEPCWAWRGHLGDYVPSSDRHPVSDFDPYDGELYLSRYPGYGFNQMMEYDYTPGALNLSAGETMTFAVPDGEAMYFETNESGGVSEYWAPITITKALPGPDDTNDMGGSVSIGPWGEEVVFEGPIDMWAWSEYQMNDSYLESEWDRLGVLPFGIPWLEFGSAVPEQPPVAVISAPETGDVGELLMFNGGASYDPDGYIEVWSWNFGDGGWEMGCIAFHSYDEPGMYVVELTVVDNNGLWDTANVTIEILGPTGVAPVAIIEYQPSLPTIGAPTLFDGSSSFDPDGSVVNYIWQFGDGTVAEGALVFHTYEHSGLYLVQLTVVDNSGLSDDSLTSITVASVPEAMFVYYPTMPAVGENVIFYAYGSYDQSEIIEYVWSFGDGTCGNGWQVDHIYDAKGSYEVVLTVKNDYGILDSTAQIVRVDSANCGLKGVVVNEDYSAIQNARVYLYSYGTVVANTMTDSSGSFSLLQLLPGQYDLVISKGGFTTLSVVVTLETGTADLGTIVMTPSKPGSTASDSGEVSENLLWPAAAAVVAALGALSAIAIRKRR